MDNEIKDNYIESLNDKINGIESDIKHIYKELDQIKTECQRLDKNFGWFVDNTKWIIATMITISIGVMGAAIAVILSK